jgi:uncharacterized protein (UPF0264 family)
VRVRLLVSVRSADEVESAWQGGADIVDAKESSTGPLDQVSPQVLRAIRARLPLDRPLSVALGNPNHLERLDRRLDEITVPVDYLKPGLAGADTDRAAALLERAVQRAAGMPGRPVVVAAGYADFRAAGSLPPAALVDLASAHGAAGMLLDTFAKDRGNLFSYITAGELSGLSHRLAAAGCWLALGGGLGPGDVDRVRETGAAILGVRGAACDGGRGGMLAVAKVRDLADRIAALSGAPG